MTPISPSELVVRAAGIPPVGSMEAETPGECVMCGRTYSAGDIIERFEPGNSFVDWAALKAPHSRLVCGCCMAVWRREFMQTLSKTVACTDGIFPMASNDHIAYWLLNPPEPPFVMYISDQQLQHLVWRTTVSYSKDLFFVRYGEQMLTIRRPVLMRAVDAVRRLLAALEASGAKSRKNVFIAISRELDDMRHGLLMEDIDSLATTEELRADVVTLRSLTAGETWALTAILYAKNPHRPEPATSPSCNLTQYLKKAALAKLAKESK